LSAEQPWKIGVARDTDGALYVPAEQVTALLRHLAAQWQAHPAHDPGTVGQLAAQVREIADQIDVECIALSRHNPGGGARPPGAG